MIENNHIFEPDVTLASELLPERSGLPVPEHALMLAVLEDAARCLLNRWSATHPKERVLYQDARDWFRSTEHARLYDFENVCDVLGIDADYLRGRIFRELEHRRAGGRPRVVALARPTADDDHDFDREAG